MATPRTKAKAAAKPASAAQAEAARDEATESAKTVAFRGATLTLPPELPATMLFDIVELEAAGDNPMPLFRLLRSVLGPEQFVEVRNEIKPDEEIVDAVDGLLTDVFGQYGLTLGKS